MVVFTEKILEEGEKIDIEEFAGRMWLKPISEITLNTGNASMTIMKKDIPDIKIKNDHLIICLGWHELRIEKRTIKGIEETKSCFFIKSGTSDIWIKKC